MKKSIGAFIILGASYSSSIYAKTCEYYVSKGEARDSSWSSYETKNPIYQAQADMVEPLFGADRVRIQRTTLENGDSSLAILDEAGNTLRTFIQTKPEGQERLLWFGEFSFGRVTSGGHLIEMAGRTGPYGDTQVLLTDLRTGKYRVLPNIFAKGDLTVSPNGRFVVSVSNANLTIFEVETGIHATLPYTGWGIAILWRPTDTKPSFEWAKDSSRFLVKGRQSIVVDIQEFNGRLENIITSGPGTFVESPWSHESDKLDYHKAGLVNNSLSPDGRVHFNGQTLQILAKDVARVERVVIVQDMTTEDGQKVDAYRFDEHVWSADGKHVFLVGKGGINSNREHVYLSKVDVETGKNTLIALVGADLVNASITTPIERSAELTAAINQRYVDYAAYMKERDRTLRLKSVPFQAPPMVFPTHKTDHRREDIRGYRVMLTPQGQPVLRVFVRELGSGGRYYLTGGYPMDPVDQQETAIDFVLDKSLKLSERTN